MLPVIIEDIALILAKQCEQRSVVVVSFITYKIHVKHKVETNRL